MFVPRKRHREEQYYWSLKMPAAWLWIQDELEKKIIWVFENYVKIIIL